MQLGSYTLLFIGVVSGLMLGTSLLHAWLWPLVFFGTVLALVVIQQSASPLHAFWLGWIIGTCKMLISLVWFWSTYPLDWLGLEPGFFHLSLVLLYWIPASLTLGLGLGLAAWVYKKYCLNVPRRVMLLLIPLLWVSAEVLGALMFSLYTLGPASAITPGFSFGHTGYALVSLNVFRYLAVFGSVYLLSFAVAFVSYLFCVQNGKQRLLFLVTLSGLVLFVPAPDNAVQGTGIKVAITETSFPSETKTNPLPRFDREQAYNDLIRYALASDSDVVVLPEDSRLTSLFVDTDQVFDFIRSITDKEIVLIDSMTINDGNKNFFRAYVYDTKTQTRFEFDKQYLVPQGEYIPYIYKTLISLLGEDVSSWAMSKGIYEPGINQSSMQLPDNVPPVLFCFESVTPFGVLNIKNSHTSFVAHVVSHAWFKREPKVFWHQLDAMLQTQALFNKVPILQSANQAQAKVYQSDGSIKYPELVASSGYWKLYITNI